MSWRLALQLVHAAYAQQGVLSSTNRSSLWTGPVLTEPSHRAAHHSSNGTAVVVGLQVFSAHGLSLRDVNNCTTCCKASSPFELFNGSVWRQVHPASFDSAASNVQLPATGADTQVRYAWSDFVQCVLVNNDSLPLGPFLLNILPSPSAADAVTSVSVPANPISAPQPLSKPPRGLNTWNFYVSATLPPKPSLSTGNFVC